MAITPDEVRRVATLARIAFTEQQLEPFAAQLSAILDYVHQLDELDLEGVEPTAHVHDAVNAFRDDEVRPSPGRDAMLANAPDRDGGCFRVQKVIEA